MDKRDAARAVVIDFGDFRHDEHERFVPESLMAFEVPADADEAVTMDEDPVPDFEDGWIFDDEADVAASRWERNYFRHDF